jgi:hypothetical protein
METLAEKWLRQKWLCEECGWQGLGRQLLQAPNPFAEGETMVGCPDCREPNSMHMACDEPGCKAHASCGTPTPDGYRHTCYKHMPK